MALNPLVSLPAFISTFVVLISFAIIVAVRKWKLLSGKIFTIHLIDKALWFLGIFLTGFGTEWAVNLGSIFFMVFGWGLGYTMLLFVFSILKNKEFSMKFLKWSLALTALFFISLFFIPGYKLDLIEGNYYMNLQYYFLIPALVLSCSYYLTIILFYKSSRSKTSKKISFYYLLFSIGLLIHSIPAHILVILESFFEQRFLILNMEYFSMIGFGIALYAYIIGFKKK